MVARVKVMVIAVGTVTCGDTGRVMAGAIGGQASVVTVDPTEARRVHSSRLVFVLAAAICGGDSQSNSVEDLLHKGTYHPLPVLVIRRVRIRVTP